MSKNKVRRVLQDHKKIGQKFVPPFAQMIHHPKEVPYVRRVIPEVLWLALINEHFGEHYGAKLSLSLAQAVEPVQTFGPLGFTSNYTQLSTEQRMAGLERLTDRPAISAALTPLVALYPECPLAFTCLPEHLANSDHDHNVATISAVTAKLMDRKTRFSVFAQANVIYIAFCTDRLKVAAHTTLAHFKEIEKYPNTEESMRVASSVRATINAMLGNVDCSWPRYFWNRGYDLSSCTLNSHSNG